MGTQMPGVLLSLPSRATRICCSSRRALTRHAAGIGASVPGGLQRFSLALNVTSSARPGEARATAIKGLVLDDPRMWWTNYEPVVITALPYHALAPVRAPPVRDRTAEAGVAAYKALIHECTELP